MDVLEKWALTKNRRFRRKVLLALKQGLVCNRCDAVTPLRNLEMDHVRPRDKKGSTQLSNLQLLCKRCYAEKGANEPTIKDYSPFAHQGPACIHRITCGEYNYQMNVA